MGKVRGRSGVRRGDRGIFGEIGGRSHFEREDSEGLLDLDAELFDAEEKDGEDGGGCG